MERADRYGKTRKFRLEEFNVEWDREPHTSRAKGHLVVRTEDGNRPAQATPSTDGSNRWFFGIGTKFKEGTFFAASVEEAAAKLIEHLRSDVLETARARGVLAPQSHESGPDYILVTDTRNERWRRFYARDRWAAHADLFAQPHPQIRGLDLGALLHREEVQLTPAMEALYHEIMGTLPKEKPVAVEVPPGGPLSASEVVEAINRGAASLGSFTGLTATENTERPNVIELVPMRRGTGEPVGINFVAPDVVQEGRPVADRLGAPIGFGAAPASDTSPAPQNAPMEHTARMDIDFGVDTGAGPDRTASVVVGMDPASDASPAFLEGLENWRRSREQSDAGTARSLAECSTVIEALEIAENAFSVFIGHVLSPQMAKHTYEKIVDGVSRRFGHSEGQDFGEFIRDRFMAKATDGSTIKLGTLLDTADEPAPE